MCLVLATDVFGHVNFRLRRGDERLQDFAKAFIPTFELEYGDRIEEELAWVKGPKVRYGALDDPNWLAGGIDDLKVKGMALLRILFDDDIPEPLEGLRKALVDPFENSDLMEDMDVS